MSRLKEKIKIKADMAAQKAKKQVYNGAKTKKRGEKKAKKEKAISTSPQTKWVEDPIGNQSLIFFNGYEYWLTMISPKLIEDKNKNKVREVFFVRLTPEQWEERTRRILDNKSQNNKL